jgi:hypothetical protein
MQKLARFMEHFWLALTIATALLAAYVWWRFGFAESRQWLLLPAMALAMWLFPQVHTEAHGRLEKRREGQ